MGCPKPRCWILRSSVSGFAQCFAGSLQPETGYEVRVRAVFGTIAGAWSEPMAASTTATAALTLTEATSGSRS